MFAKVIYNCFVFEMYGSLTEVIRTCLKDRIFGTFWLVVLERRQPSVVLRTKIYSKIQPLRSENFKREDF